MEVGCFDDLSNSCEDALRRVELITNRKLRFELGDIKNASQLSGRTENNRVVNFTDNQGQIGEFIDLRITEALPNSLRGESIAENPLSSVMINTASLGASSPD